MPTPGTLTAETARRVTRRDQFIGMALHAQGRDYGNWPGWSTGETLIVALILNRTDVLQAMRFTVVEAFERCDLFTLHELVHMQREVNS